MIKEIKSEIWYVLILWIIITWGIAICDIDQRLSSHAVCDQFICYDVPVPDGFERAIIK